MIKFNGIEHIDEFEDCNVIFIEVTNIPEWVVKEAKRIDKEEYLDSCFGMWMVEDEDGIGVATDNGNNLYYIDNNGNKNWFYVEGIDVDSLIEGIKSDRQYIRFVVQ